MPEMDGSSKPPPISEMFQKFALAFKSKTFEFFTDEEPAGARAGAAADSYDSDGFSLLDSAEEVITGQKVVVIKPDQPAFAKASPAVSEVKTPSNSETQIRPMSTQFSETLISSLFATISSFEASYLQFQTAHVPFVEESISAADKSAVSHLQKLSDFKKLYREVRRNPNSNLDFPIGSSLEAQVEENQSKLRAMETVSNRLQLEIDDKAAEVLILRHNLDNIRKLNLKFSKRLSDYENPSSEVLLSIRVFDSILRDACRSMHVFTKILIDLMKKAKWDLDLAANSVHPNIDYGKKGHRRYAFLSYVCLGMFQGFDSEGYGLDGNEVTCNGDSANLVKNSSLKQLIEHVSDGPLEILKKPNAEFSKFYETKYQELIHPTMQSSIFSNLDQNEVVLNSWRSLSVFYESFVNMASSIWMLHKLAFAFNPVVEIFRVEQGVEFSMVYMEDVTRKSMLPGKTRGKVGFTVVPGFKIGKTVIQAQVYVTSMKCTEQ